jgi:excisionase family DNA binding protein
MPSTDATERRVLAYSVDEAAEMLGLHRATIYDLCHQGRIASLKIGRRRLIPRAALEALLELPDPQAERTEVQRRRRERAVESVD